MASEAPLSLSAREPWRWLLIGASAAAAVWVWHCFLRIHAPDVVYVDEGTFHYLGWLWFSGAGQPYVDAIENKPPGIFVLFGAAEQVFGTPYPWVRYAALGCIVWGAALLYGVLRRLVPEVPARLAALIYLIAATNQTTSPYAAMTTPFMVFFTIASLAAASVARGRALPVLLSGVFAALALSFKQAALLEGALLWFCCASGWPFEPAGQRRLRLTPLLAWAAGWLIVQGGTCAVLASQGVLHDYLASGWLGAAAPGTSAPTVAGKLDHLARTAAWFATYAQPLLLGPIALAGVVRRPSVSERAPVWFGVAWTLAAMPFSIGGWSWAHRFVQLFPPLALLTALALAMLHEAIEGKRGRVDPLARVSVTGMVAIVIGLSLVTGGQRWERFTITRPTLDWIRCVELIRERTTPEDRIYVMQWWDQIYATAQRRAVTRYGNRSFLGKPGALEEVRSTLEQTPPKMIVLAALKPQPYAAEYFGAVKGAEVYAYLDWLEDLVATEYDLVERTSAWRLYQLREPGAAEPEQPSIGAVEEDP